MSNNEQQYRTDPGETTSNSIDSQQNAQPQSSNATATSNRPPHASKQMNLQRIQQLKQNELSLPYTKKLLKLGLYSKCQVNLLKLFHMYSIN